jgi:hypothetical protein
MNEATTIVYRHLKTTGLDALVDDTMRDNLDALRDTPPQYRGVRFGAMLQLAIEARTDDDDLPAGCLWGDLLRLALAHVKWGDIGDALASTEALRKAIVAADAKAGAPDLLTAARAVLIEVDAVLNEPPLNRTLDPLHPIAVQAEGLRAAIAATEKESSR